MGLSFSFVSKGAYPSFLKIWTGISVQLFRERGINKWVGGREWEEGRENSFRKGDVEIEAWRGRGKRVGEREGEQ